MDGARCAAAIRKQTAAGLWEAHLLGSFQIRRGYGLTLGIRFTTEVNVAACNITWVLADAQFDGAPIRIEKNIGNGVVVSREDISAAWIIIVSLTGEDTVGLQGS